MGTPTRERVSKVQDFKKRLTSAIRWHRTVGACARPYGPEFRTHLNFLNRGLVATGAKVRRVVFVNQLDVETSASQCATYALPPHRFLVSLVRGRPIPASCNYGEFGSEAIAFLDTYPMTNIGSPYPRKSLHAFRMLFAGLSSRIC